MFASLPLHNAVEAQGLSLMLGYQSTALVLLLVDLLLAVLFRLTDGLL